MEKTNKLMITKEMIEEINKVMPKGVILPETILPLIEFLCDQIKKFGDENLTLKRNIGKQINLIGELKERLEITELSSLLEKFAELGYGHDITLRKRWKNHISTSNKEE